MTDRMDSLLNLSDKQYKKIYKLNLKEAGEQTGNRMEGGPRPDMAGGRDFGGGRPPQGETDGKQQGNRPPEGMGNRPPHDFGGGKPGNMKSSEKERGKREKKLRKILSSEQYERWEKERRHHDFKGKPSKKINEPEKN